jgi:hypothetical protein
LDVVGVEVIYNIYIHLNFIVTSIDSYIHSQ